MKCGFTLIWYYMVLKQKSKGTCVIPHDYEDHDCVMSSNLKMGQAVCLKQRRFLWCSQRKLPPLSILSPLFTGHPTETKLGSGLLDAINCRLINYMYKGLKLFQALHIGLTISLLVESSSKK